MPKSIGVKPSVNGSANAIGPEPISGVFSFVGQRFSGKTKMAKMVAERIGFPFFDTDEIFNRQYNMTVSEFLDSGGRSGNWEPFRRAESGIVLDLYSALPKNAIVALGGGVPAHKYAYYRNQNVQAMRSKGFVIYLRPDPLESVCVEILVRRETQKLNDPNRPNLNDSQPFSLYDRTRQILVERDPFYQSVSDVIVYEPDSRSPLPHEAALETRAEEIIKIMSTLRK